MPYAHLFTALWAFICRVCFGLTISVVAMENSG